MLSWIAHQAATSTVGRQPQGRTGLPGALAIDPAARMAELVQAAFESFATDHPASVP